MSHTNAIGNSQVLQSLLGQSDRVQSAKKDSVQLQAATSPTAQATTTQLSSAGSALAQVASTTDDVRTEKVGAIQQAIAAGTYSVPASAVADKLIQHLLG